MLGLNCNTPLFHGHLPIHLAKEDIVLLLREKKNHGEIFGFMLRPRIPMTCLPNLNLFQQGWSRTDAIIHAGGVVTQRKVYSAWPKCFPGSVATVGSTGGAASNCEVKGLHRQDESTLAYLML